MRALYGADHPYGYIELGTESSMKATTRDDLANFWKQNFVPNNAALVVAGPIDRGGLASRSSRRRSARGPRAPRRRRRERHVATDARAAGRGRSAGRAADAAARGDDRRRRDRRPTTRRVNVMNLMLGGLFSSRINLNLREAHGYTYGAFSQFVFRKHARAVLVQIRRPHRSVTAPAVAEILKEVKRMTDTSRRAPTSSTMAKDAHRSRSLPADFETSASAVGQPQRPLHLQPRARLLHDVPGGGRRPSRADAVQAAARKYLHPDKIIVIAVGDRKEDRSRISGS